LLPKEIPIHEGGQRGRERGRYSTGRVIDTGAADLILGPFTSHAYPKYFLFHSSHRIFRRMYGALNVGKKNN
jgi:hypothetical protein